MPLPASFWGTTWSLVDKRYVIFNGTFELNFQKMCQNMNVETYFYVKIC